MLCWLDKPQAYLQDERDKNPKGNPTTASQAFSFSPILQWKNWVNDKFLSFHFVFKSFSGQVLLKLVILQHNTILALAEE